MIIENNGIDYEICKSQADIIESIKFILKENTTIKTIDGDQVFFKINCGELTFKITVEKSTPDPKPCNPCTHYSKKYEFKCELL
jgi:hypothetical protein